MNWRKSFVALLVVCATALITTDSIRANVAENHVMHLTFSRPVALPGVVLASGTYIFEMPDPVGAPDVVRVLSRDRKTVYFSAFTYEVSRPANLPREQLVSFAESAADRAVPIAIWWSEGSVGRQFMYR